MKKTYKKIAVNKIVLLMSIIACGITGCIVQSFIQADAPCVSCKIADDAMHQTQPVIMTESPTTIWSRIKDDTRVAGDRIRNAWLSVEDRFISQKKHSLEDRIHEIIATLAHHKEAAHQALSTLQSHISDEAHAKLQAFHDLATQHHDRLVTDHAAIVPGPDADQKLVDLHAKALIADRETKHAHDTATRAIKASSKASHKKVAKKADHNKETAHHEHHEAKSKPVKKDKATQSAKRVRSYDRGAHPRVEAVAARE